MMPSTPKRRGASEAWAALSTSSEKAKNDLPARMRWNSGSQRPAWRMAHTGGRSTASPRIARTNKCSGRGIPISVQTRNSEFGTRNGKTEFGPSSELLAARKATRQRQPPTTSPLVGEVDECRLAETTFGGWGGYSFTAIRPPPPSRFARRRPPPQGGRWKYGLPVIFPFSDPQCIRGRRSLAGGRV